MHAALKVVQCLLHIFNLVAKFLDNVESIAGRNVYLFVKKFS